MDIFEHTCKCGAVIEVRVPRSLNMGGVKCPACGRTSHPHIEFYPEVRPQHDTSQSPAPQKGSTHFRK